MEQPTTALVPTVHNLPAEAEIREALTQIEIFRKIVHANLVEGVDFGPPFPGSDRPGLLKPGAEKITKLLKCTATYETMEVVTDWEKPIFAWVMKCRLVITGTGEIWSEGQGECNSMEGRYRYRYAERTCPLCEFEGLKKSKRDPEWYCWQKLGGCGATFPLDDPKVMDQVVGKVLNEDIYAQRNTILKMAEKRALIDAALAGGRLSDVFTQDVEDHDAGQTNGQAAMAVEVGPMQNGPNSDGQGAPIKEPELNNVGDLLNAVNKAFGKRGDEVFNLLHVSAARGITDFKEAWATCVETWG